jgi:hypothetical protein
MMVLLGTLIGFLGVSQAYADWEWSGSAGTRYVLLESNDGLETKNADGKDSSLTTTETLNVRAALLASFKGEEWDSAVGLRTYSNQRSEWLTVNGNADRAINLEQAFLRYKNDLLGGKFNASLGRQLPVFLFDSTAQGLFDKDVRWDGLGWAWENDQFGLNLAQYVLGARNSGTVGESFFSRTDASAAVADTQSSFGWLAAFQPHYTLKLSDEISGKFAIGYFAWIGTGGSSTSGYYSNAIHGGVAGAAGNVNPVLLDNSRQWQIFTDWKFPMKLRFMGEYVQNKKINYGTRTAPTNRAADRDMLSLTLAYGSAKKTGDWSVAYSYVDRGIASVIGTYSFGNFSPDNISHQADFKFAIADGFVFNAKGEWAKEKGRVGGDGLALASPNQKRLQKQARYEFVTSVAF